MNVFMAAKEEYAKTEGHEFILERVWERVRNDPKWLSVTPVQTRRTVSNSTSGSKRSRGESSHDVSDAHVNIDLNAGSFAEDDTPSPGSRPPAGRDKAKRIARHTEDHEKKMKQRDDIVAKLDVHLSAVDEKKAMKRRQLELQEEAQEGTILLNHLSILEKDGLDEQDREIVAAAKSKSRSWMSKFFSKK